MTFEKVADGLTYTDQIGEYGMPEALRFGLFEFGPRLSRLTRNGHGIKLQAKAVGSKYPNVLKP